MHTLLVALALPPVVRYDVVPSPIIYVEPKDKLPLHIPLLFLLWQVRSSTLPMAKVCRIVVAVGYTEPF